jgi:PKD repeat protein
MFKQFRLIILMLFPVIASGQNSNYTNYYKKIVSDYLVEKKTELNLTDKDIKDWIVNSCYTDKSGTTYFYIDQVVNDIRIFNAVTTISISQSQVKTFANRIFPDAASKINTLKPGFGPLMAIDLAADFIGTKEYSKPILVSKDRSLNRTYYSSDLSKEKIRIELVFQPVNNLLRLAYDVNVRQKDNKHWWNVRFDAINGEILDKNDWTVHCDFGGPGLPVSTPNLQTGGPSNSNGIQQTQMMDSYRVYKLPLEAPSFGASTLEVNPADPVASPFGWHDVDGITGPEYSITRGNNVFAYEDTSDINAPGFSPDGGANFLFDFPVNLVQQPRTYLPGSITNLFYINNMMHDILAHHGFDEASGNFQQTNYSGVALGNDYVVAEAQDGGGTSNANFSTPDDGQNGWMQMYLWSGSVSSFLTINSPAPIAGSYNCVPAGFGPNISVPITEDVMIVDDGNGTTTDACEPLINGPALNGKIALIDRGICNFADKVLEAQNAGAIAAIVANNAAGAPFAMGGNGNSGSVTIPSVMISQADGNTIKASMAGGNTVNITLNASSSIAIDIDGSLDNGVIMHEFGHGVSNRLTGPLNNSNCLNNAEQGGEGWSDFFALLFTMKPGDVGTAARGMGTFALGEPTNGGGIRRYPYSTNMNIDPLTYGDIAQSNEAHDIGEIWCSVLWDMTWQLVDSFGFDADWINGNTLAGNQIALDLVIEGMKRQGCSPTFLDARNGILAADDAKYGGVHKCIIWDAFARRGMGKSASAPHVEQFDKPNLCMIALVAPVANFVANDTSSCFGIISFNDISTDIPQAWLWDFGDGLTSTQEDPTHQYLNPGTYNVKLIVTNTIGGDTMVRNNYITITSPHLPVVTGDTTVCTGFSTTLTAVIDPGNICEWRDVNDSVLFTGTVFNTPVINSPTTYKVTQFSPTTISNVGAANTSIGTGGYHATTFEGKEVFTTFVPVRIKSVWVDAGGASVRDFNLYQNNVLIWTRSILVANGQQRIQLNLDIPSPGNYELGVAAGSNLYRNTTGAVYPYTAPGLLSITSSNSTQNPAIFYYYLYDWEVQEIPCTSAPLTVNVSANTQLSSFTFVDNGLSVNFNSTGVGAISWQWTFGDGQNSTQQNPVITYSTPGNYTVSLTTTDGNGCQSVTAHIITVTILGIAQLEDNHLSIIHDGDNLLVKFDSPADKARIRIYDAIGKLIINDEYDRGMLYSIPTGAIASEFLMINVDERGKSYSKKIVLMN